MKAKVCPNCGSPEIEYASLDKRSGSIIGFGIPEKYFCKDCSYTGSVILEVDSARLKKMKFPKKKMNPYKLKYDAATKPILIFCLFAFVLASIFIAMPRQKITTSSFETGAGNLSITIGDKSYDILYGTKSTVTGAVGNAQITITGEPKGNGMQITIKTMNETSLLEEMSGISSVTGWLVSVLLMFSIFGILFMLYLTHQK